MNNKVIGNEKNIIFYNDEEGNTKIEVLLQDEDVWLNTEALAELFSIDRSGIVRHINNIYKDNELNENSTCAKIAHVGNVDKQIYNTKYYNLDMIISIGYRVNSITATKFRQWATYILKEYISKGYAVNTHKITEYRLANLENDMQIIKSKIKNDTLDLKQGIFYEGQFFDAYIFISDILKNAKKSITLIDNYIDGNTLLHLSSNKDLNINIITKSLTKELKVIIEKFNKQYKNLKVFEYSKSHDRFLIIDEKIIYHIGASLKDLGNKWFAFSKLEDDNFELLKRIANILGNK